MNEIYEFGKGGIDLKNMDTVYCAAVTPMNSDLSIDYDGIRSNINWYKKEGLGGILVCGGTGEFVSLTQTERKKVTEAAIKANDGKCQIMVCCAAETTAEAIDYASHAEASGADSLLLIASYYFKPSDEELIAHFRALARSTKLPVVLYNNPGSCGSNLTPALVKALSAEPNIKHMKDATGDLLQFRSTRNAVDENFHMWIGCDALACELIKNGATGWISITANALASQSQELFDNMMSGREQEAWNIYNLMLPIYTTCESPYKAIQKIKYIMDRIGCAGGASRGPRLALTDGEKQELNAMLVTAGIVK